MRWKLVGELTKVNLLYANPQMIEKKRNKEAETGKPSKVSAYKSVLGQNLLMFVIFFFLFFVTMSIGINYADYPGLFTINVLVFLMMSFLQSFLIVYNLFYESKDLEYYLPLPFKSSEIFAAKLSVLALMISPYLVPVLGLFVLLGLSTENSYVLSLLGAVVLFLLLMAILVLVSFLLVHFMTSLAVFRKNKNVVSTVLYTVSSIGMIVAVLFITNNPLGADTTLPGQLIPDSKAIPFIESFYTLLVYPSQFEGWLGLAGWLLVLIVLSGIVYKWVVPNFYGKQKDSAENETQEQTEQPVQNKRQVISGRVKNAKPESVNRILWKYNAGLIQDGTLIMQFISSKILFPVLLLGPTLWGGLDLSSIPLDYWGVFFFGGFIYAFLTLNSISIVGVIISLDRENFLYMKSLPFSMKRYLKQKLWFAYAVELLIPFVLGVIFMVLIKLPILLGLLLLLGLVIGTYALCLFYFVRDHKKLYIDWQNLTELFNRGGGNFIQVISIMGSIFIGVILVALLSFLVTALPPIGRLAVSVLAVLVPIAVSASVIKWYNKQFWPQFKE